MSGYFFTGFPGFICQELVKEVLKEENRLKKLFLLVLPTMKNQAITVIQKLEQQYPNISFTLIEGDITQPDLMIKDEDLAILKQEVHFVFHLAAVYDLAVKKEIAYQVNVNGTKQVLDLLKKLTNLKRFIYFSTAYVAGLREGKIYEHELMHSSGFKNHYEHTKYLAEVLVEDEKRVIPTTIIRPGIVKGHSQTGETNKFDGPYFMLNFLDALKFLPFIPHLGKGEAEFNVVPIDYIVKGTCHLAYSEKAEGKTLHLTNPSPISIREAYSIATEILLQKAPKGSIPLSLAKSFLRVPTARKWLKVERQALDYFTWKGSFECPEAKGILSDTNIHCPSFKETADCMVKYYNQHKSDELKHVQIS
ncbi:thioester reductase-like protein [Bacillus tianshenii]|uniref:Thioester reductase-like protein n=1 Tax=Sutcliffiella tianshenii TaxID=1463404 RepID=A0ABS2P5K0_9BACI|nr:SDR family oxidoreductase [Bacillus tianshenii]MBM7622230.1 thioester reductase-like protein [Bacillus tianshenii]